MKAKIMVVIWIITILMLTIYIYNLNSKYNKLILENKSYVKEYLDEILLDEFYEKYIQEEEMIIYVGRPDCSDSREFEQWFEPIVIKYNLNDKIQYLNIKPITDKYELYKNLTESKYGFKNTPTLIHYKNGEIHNIQEWTVLTGFTEEMVIEFLEESNLIQ